MTDKVGMIEGIIQENVAEYLERFVPRRDGVFKDMEAYALEHDVPIVGPHVGALLFMMATSANAKRVLELGTAIGYSGSWLARALPGNGKLTTIEWDSEMASVANKNFEKAGVLDKVELIEGSAMELMPGLEGHFDPHCITRLKKGGLFITDNVLWSGRVADPTSPKDDPETSTIKEFTKKVFSSNELLTVLVPLRDGITISFKL
jgi:predicted O-methyltransferase YrrM